MVGGSSGCACAHAPRAGVADVLSLVRCACAAPAGKGLPRAAALPLTLLVGKMAAFAELGICPEIVEAVVEDDWLLPTPVQSEAIPLILGVRKLWGGKEGGREEKARAHTHTYAHAHTHTNWLFFSWLSGLSVGWGGWGEDDGVCRTVWGLVVCVSVRGRGGGEGEEGRRKRRRRMARVTTTKEEGGSGRRRLSKTTPPPPPPSQRQGREGACPVTDEAAAVAATEEERME